MESITKILVVITLLLSFTACNAQIRNSKTETMKIYGNCGMCKTTIEKAGNAKKVANVNWNIETNMATIAYDTTKTNLDEILKRVALAGYDSDKFLAPDDVYSNLAACCQYERVSKPAAMVEPSNTHVQDHSHHTATDEKQAEGNQLKALFDTYFALKDALVQSDGNTTSLKAKDLLNLIASVKMETLTTDEHNTWMKVMKDLSFDAEHISDTKNVTHQRDHFMSLSVNMYELIKVSGTDTAVYYQFCPMANDGKGAYWLSKENAIKNPYYGSQMLTCGKTTETIDN